MIQTENAQPIRITREVAQLRANVTELLARDRLFDEDGFLPGGLTVCEFVTPEGYVLINEIKHVCGESSAERVTSFLTTIDFHQPHWSRRTERARDRYCGGSMHPPRDIRRGPERYR